MNDSSNSSPRPARVHAILGIDAAWTDTQPSGVALITRSPSGWRCVAVASSYSDFVSLVRSDAPNADQEHEIFPSRNPDIDALMSAAEQLADTGIDLVAVDMPMAYDEIVGRRVSDQMVSKAFGRRGCSTHSPNKLRPGDVGRRLMRGLEQRGFVLATGTNAPASKVLIEVYPHPALLSLMRATERLSYKVGKSARSYRKNTKAERIEILCALYADILLELSRFIEVHSTVFRAPEASEITHISSLKSYEDSIDALVCAWVGILYVEGQTVQMGGDRDAICVPRDVVQDPIDGDAILAVRQVPPYSPA